MRSVLVISGVVAGVVAGSSLLGPSQQARQPRFVNRAVVSGAAAKCPPEDLPPQLVTGHQIFSERCLLIRDTAVVDSADFDSAPACAGLAPACWSFGSVLQLAFNRAAKAEVPEERVRGFVTDWRASLKSMLAFSRFDEAWRAADPGLSLRKAPVRLLAIVNRMDLARLEPAGMCGAEVRFIFGAIPPPAGDLLSMIVEFVIPCLTKTQFKLLAGEWASLETLDWAGSAPPYHAKLKNLLAATAGRAKAVRLRLTINNFGTWDVRQFAFGSMGLDSQALDREPNVKLGECQGRKTALGQFAIEQRASILASTHTLTSDLIKFESTVDTTAPNVLTLSPDTPIPELDRVRFALSVNSCVGCHGRETNTNFHHVKNRRKRGDKSILSSFLTGSPTGEPSATLCFKFTPPLAACGTTAEPREFNDLLRRHLFLHTVRSLDPNAPDQKWQEELEKLGLTALQVH